MMNPSLEQHTQALAFYLPSGPLFEAKNIYDSNFRQLLRGLAGELRTAQGYICTLENEYFPDETVLFIEEWERALCIPDDCFPGTGTTAERRRDILVKLASAGVQTVADFERLGDIYGIALNVFPLADDPVLQATLGISDVDARFVLIVEGPDITSSVPPYDVPFDLDVGEIILTCLLTKQAQSNGNVIFTNS